MKRFILLTFALLGWTFWEMSGGADYAPRDLAQTPEAAPAAQTAEAPAPVYVAPATDLQTATPRVTRVELSDAPAPDTPRATTAALPSLGEVGGTVTLEQPEVTLISLEQSAGRFARPLDSLDDPAGDDTAAGDTLSAAIADAVEAAQPETTITDLPTDIREVNGTRVNMRSGPGTQHQILGRLSLGDEVVVLSDPGNGWLRLRPLTGDQVGWISASLISGATDR